jgi:HNH endonuclease
MRLPDFTDDAGLIALRRSMGAEAPGSFLPNYRPDELSLKELQQLATDGKDVSIEDVVVLEDGTLRYKESRVVVYIRDVIAYGSHQDDPRFHVADCTTLRRMRQINRFGRYVVATRRDGRFLVNRISNHNKISSREIPLKICQNCLNTLAFDNFSFSLSPSDRTKIVLHFTIGRFFEKYPISLLHWRPKADAAAAPINYYPADFDRFSKRVRERRDWRCECCRRDFSRGADREYLHVHHKNGIKNENSEENLQVLCLGCHAAEPQHAHLKNLAEYREFMRRFGLY